jgi:acetyltransferase-like isoleucine patch superfamily enzyme
VTIWSNTSERHLACPISAIVDPDGRGGGGAIPSVRSAPRTACSRWRIAEPITIADNVWLGGGVILCPGVTIGQDTVVGAGAVVTKDLPAGVVAAAVPARVLREIGDRDRVEVPAT